MMIALKTLTTVAVAGMIATGLAFAAAADDDDRGWMMGRGMGPMMGGWGMGGPMMHGPMMGYGSGPMLDYVDGRLAFMKAELKITDEQSSAWDELAEAIHTTAEAHNDQMRAMMEQMHDGDFSKMSLPERLQFQQTHMEARLEQLKTVSEAVEKLYAMLDGDQKEAADDIVLPVMGMGMGMRGMRGGGGWGRMMRRP